MKIKSIISVLLAVLLLSVIPTTAFAEHRCSYVYTASENVITEDCIYCDHLETATLSAVDEDVVYDGNPKEGATVLYSQNWKGGQLTVNYENNTNACDMAAYASIQKENAKAELYFTILAATPDHSIPTGLTATYGSTLSNIALPEATNGTWEWLKPNEIVNEIGSNTFKALFTPNDTDNYITLLLNVPVTVNRKKIAKPIGDNSKFIYDGKEKTYVIADSSDYTVKNNVQTNAGPYKVTVSLADAVYTEWEDGSTADLTFDFNIAKADQDAPTVNKVDETISGKNDGKITDVTDKMEYRTESESTYKAISGDKIENLADGKYYIRIKGDDNYNASPEAEVVIGAGRMLVVTYRADGKTVDTVKVEYGKDAKAPAIPEKDGYTETAPTWDNNGKNITADIEINAVYTKDPVKNSEEIKSPQTGDNSNICLWILLMAVSGAMLFALTLYNRKMKSTNR